MLKRIDGKTLRGARRLTDALAERVRELYHSGWADEMEHCWSSVTGDAFDNGTLRFHPRYRCDHGKVCAFCAHHDANERFRKYGPVIKGSGKYLRLQFLTLTTLSVPLSHLQAQVARCWSWWDKLRRRNVWANVVAASLPSVEVTWSDTHGWHVHLHVLVALPWDEDYSWSGVQAAWHQLSGAPIVDFRKVPADDYGQEKAIKELLKYPAKLNATMGKDGEPIDGLLQWPDAVFLEYIVWARKARTFRSYGLWYNPPEVKVSKEGGAEEPKVVASFEFTWDRKKAVFNVSLIQGHKSTDHERDEGEEWPDEPSD